MANVKICDRCRSELIERQTIINLRPVRHILGVEVFARSAGTSCMLRTAGHSFDLCDDCANKLGKFLMYSPGEATDE